MQELVAVQHQADCSLGVLLGVSRLEIRTADCFLCFIPKIEETIISTSTTIDQTPRIFTLMSTRFQRQQMAQTPQIPKTLLGPEVEDDAPPQYTEEKPLSPDDMLQPTTFILQGLEIHTYPPLPDAIPSYKLSRVIHAQGTATHSIDIARVESITRVSPRTGNLVISKRERELYDLQYWQGLLGAPFLAEAKPHGANRTLGEMSIARAPRFHHGYRVIKVLKPEEMAMLERRREKPKNEWWWSMRDIRGRGNAWEWSNAMNDVVARQTTDIGEGGEAEHRLEVVKALPRRTMDSLVSIWCLWMWHLHIEETASHKSWSDVKRIMQAQRDPMLPQGGFLSMQWPSSGRG